MALIRVALTPDALINTTTNTTNTIMTSNEDSRSTLLGTIVPTFAIALVLGIARIFTRLYPNTPSLPPIMPLPPPWSLTLSR